MGRRQGVRVGGLIGYSLVGKEKGDQIAGMGTCIDAIVIHRASQFIVTGIAVHFLHFTNLLAVIVFSAPRCLDKRTAALGLKKQIMRGESGELCTFYSDVPYWESWTIP